MVYFVRRLVRARFRGATALQLAFLRAVARLGALPPRGDPQGLLVPQHARRDRADDLRHSPARSRLRGRARRRIDRVRPQLDASPAQRGAVTDADGRRPRDTRVALVVLGLSYVLTAGLLG